MDFPTLKHPVIAAPMGGGPSTPELVAAVSNAGGLGFLAAGYKTAAALSEEIVAVRRLTPAPFGVNIFVPSRPTIDKQALMIYADQLQAEAERYGTKVGEPRWTDDEWQAKLLVVRDKGVPVASFTFGSPPADIVEDLHAREIAAWCTVTSPEEAIIARDAGVDALVVQGVEAGAHRGSFDDDPESEGIALLPLLRLVASVVDLPLIAAGGIADGAGVAAVLAAGARAAQIGTAFLQCPEAGTSAVHRNALAKGGHTGMTRAFTGRSARGIVNRFMREHRDAPLAYPQVHYLTASLRTAARERSDPDGVNLWAGQALALAEEAPAADLVQRWSADARAALVRAQARWRTA